MQLSWRLAGTLALLGTVLASCSEEADRRTVVASFHPLAFVAERVAAPGWEVIDLTPPGVEAHDVEISLEDRAAIQEAELVLYLGDIGFQPQVEEAVDDATGRVLDASAFAGPGVLADPHVWLVPAQMVRIAEAVSSRIPRSTPSPLQRDLLALERRYGSTLQGCRYGIAIVPHEAFGHAAAEYGFEQFGLAGEAPEGDPTAGRLADAQELIEAGQAGAVFFEPTDEGSRRIAEALAADAGVPALPLSTLESRPPTGDYLTVMEDNLESLRRGLGCP